MSVDRWRACAYNFSVYEYHIYSLCLNFLIRICKSSVLEITDLKERKSIAEEKSSWGKENSETTNEGGNVFEKQWGVSESYVPWKAQEPRGLQLDRGSYGWWVESYLGKCAVNQVV